MSRPVPQRPSFAPRHWGGWLIVAFLFVLGRLPATLGRWMVAPLGPLMFHLMSRRRQVARRNIEACFPEWSDEKREDVLRQGFASLARMLVEMAWCWTGQGRKVLAMGDIHGLEHAHAAAAEGGVLMVTAHSTCLEVGGRLLCEHLKGGAIYRPLNNEVVEWYQTRGRLQYADTMISKRDMRGAIRYLRQGNSIWYAPDQDFGPKESLFAPFFGIQTATLMATHRLPGMTGCKVVPMVPRYDPEKRRYDVYIMPAIDNFPSDDPQADLERVNGILEDLVRQAPEQYWWIHRRFKTRPEGEAPFYD